MPGVLSAAMDAKTIVVLEGDETGPELLEEALRVLAPEVTGLELEFPRFDLSLSSRRATKNTVVHEAAQAITEHGLGLKAATITPEGRDDVGSPNRILREEIGAKVFGGPKYTVSPIYEGMLKEEMDAAAERHPEVPYEPQLIDATFALLIASAGDPLVIPALNRDGDILSDLVLPLFGSIAGSESLLVAFEDDYEPRALMAEAAHGTAPSLRGKNVANPMAMILAGAALLSYGDEGAQQVGRAIRESALEAVSQGVRTADLGGHAGTTEFTEEVIRRTRSKLEVWATL